MKKGFTLIELLGIIVILGLIVAFTVPSLINLKKNEEQKEYDNFLKNVSLAAETFYQTNTKMCDFDNYTYCYINVSDLIENNYLRNDLINPKNKNVISYLDTVILEKNEDNTIKYYYSSMDGYVKDNLLVHYDAIRNTNSGHDYLTTTWKDLSGNNNDGNLYGFSFDENSGWTNNSLNINGKMYVRAINRDLTDFTNEDFTVIVTFRTPEIISDPVLVSTGGWKKNGFYIQFRTNNCVSLNVNQTGASQSIWTLQNSLKPNQLTNLTFVRSGSTIKSYINGNYNTKINTALDLENAAFAYTINNNKNWVGEIMNTKVYNRVLTDEEIKNNYNVDKYRFDV